MYKRQACILRIPKGRLAIGADGDVVIFDPEEKWTCLLYTSSVLDEYYWLNKHDPKYSLQRATVNRGQDAHTDGKFALSDKASMELSLIHI